MRPHSSSILKQLPAALFLLGAVAIPAQTIDDAARQVAAIVPAHTRVSLVVENRAGLEESVVVSMRTLLGQLLDVAEDGAPLRIILSENVRGPLAIAVFSGRTMIAPVALPPATGSRGRPKLIATSVWTQAERPLDVMATPEVILILESGRLALYRRSGETWRLDKAQTLVFNAPMPRDPRGRLTGTVEAFRILTPAGACTGSATPTLTVNCTDPGILNPWVAGRNFERDSNLGEFYNSATLADGRVISAQVSGGFRIGNAALALSGLGTELTAAASNCGVSWLATGAGAGGTDSVFGMSAAGAAATDPLTVAGTIRELSTSDSTAYAIVEHPGTRTHEIIRLAIACPE